jgi:hypothetical protein
MIEYKALKADQSKNRFEYEEMDLYPLDGSS